MTDLRELLRRAMPLLNYALDVPAKELETQQLMNEIRAALTEDAAGPAHTDHPPRHWERTCPACINERDSLVILSPSAPARRPPELP